MYETQKLNGLKKIQLTWQEKYNLGSFKKVSTNIVRASKFVFEESGARFRAKDKCSGLNNFEGHDIFSA